MNYATTNMTDEEVFRMTGNLPPDRVEKLLNRQDTEEIINSINVYASEARMTVEEDFLSDQTTRLFEIAKKLRGDNRKDLEEVIEEIRLSVQEMVNAASYSNEQLDLIVKEVRKAQDQ